MVFKITVLGIAITDRRSVSLLSLAVALLVLVTACSSPTDTGENDAELDASLLELVTLDGQRRVENFLLPESDDLGNIPQDPANPLSAARVDLGKLLFHDPALSSATRNTRTEGTFSCASCHHAAAGFEAGAQRSIAEGGFGWGVRGEARRPATDIPPSDVDSPPVKSQSILNKAYQRLMMFTGAAGTGGPNAGTDGKWSSDPEASANSLGYLGLESQAIAALSKHRMDDLPATEALISSHATYSRLWKEAFGGDPVTIERVGLAIAAYERTVFANRSPWQRWLRGESRAMTASQKRGAAVFFGPALCSDCHSGPALASMSFYALGMPDMPGTPPHLGRGGFTGETDMEFTFKVPQLYNLSDAGFLGHGGTFRSMRQMVDYYVAGVPDVSLPAGRVTDQFHPLELTRNQIDDLIDFLEDGLHDPDLMRYQPASVPSGGCIPANDPQARVDLGC